MTNRSDVIMSPCPDCHQLRECTDANGAVGHHDPGAAGGHGPGLFMCEPCNCVWIAGLDGTLCPQCTSEFNAMGATYNPDSKAMARWAVDQMAAAQRSHRAGRHRDS
jgi:hypothetical protein